MTDPLRLTARTLVVDLEGTTSAAGFILGDLYDYARPRLQSWLEEHANDAAVAEARAQAIADAGLPSGADTGQVVGVLHEWMAQDVKATPLKTLQGQIWAEGYRRGEISTHFFDDVIPRLRSWHAAGVAIAVFSSGSVASQVPWFRHSPDGDLTPLVSDYFDTVNAGPKKLASSYDAIAQRLGRRPGELVFFTDNPDELAAAGAAGWQVVAFSREGEPFFGADFGDAPVVSSFAEVEVVAPVSRASVFDRAPVTECVIARAGAALAAESARFAAMGWMPGTAGNLSVTLARDPLRLAVTASGLDKGELTETDIVVVDAAGEAALIEGLGEPDRAQRPSAEAGLHARIAALTGAGAVIHVHALAAVVAAHEWPDGVVLRDLEMLKGIGHSAHDEVVVIPVVANGQDMAVLGDEFERLYVPADEGGKDVPALLVAGHGIYAWGADLKQARWHLELTEALLQIALATR